jgi:hypothetical protein
MRRNDCLDKEESGVQAKNLGETSLEADLMWVYTS